MNTLHFKYALEVLKTGSISHAAENLFMAQPNLSKAIKELEETLGIAIFQRTSKGVIPTEEGKEFLEYARNILGQVEKMESLHIPKGQREDCQEFKVSIPRGSYISTGFAKFAAELDMTKGINVTIQETNSLQTIQNVTECGYNLGIVRYQTIYETYFLDYLKEKGLCFEPIWEFSCLALMSNHHPMANCDEIDGNELQQTSCEIVHGDNVIPYISSFGLRQMEEPIDHIKKKIYVYERGSQLELLTQVTNSFMWVSPLPEELLQRYQLVQRVCKMKNNQLKDVLIYPKNYTFTTVDKQFLNKLYEIKNEVAFVQYH